MLDIKQLRNIPRVGDIVTTLVYHGFEHVTEALGITTLYTRVRTIIRRPEVPEVTITLPARLRNLLQDLGPTFIKLGQILSTRRDLLPEDFVEELARLQDHVPPMDPEKVDQVFQEELGKPPRELFAEFDPVPLGAASIGQVHRARTHDGREIAIKVQRAGIRSTIRSDLELLTWGARKFVDLELISPVYDIPGIIDEFSRSIREELDYNREAQNIATFTRNFEGDPTVRFPQVHPEFSTGKLLAMEFMRGVKADRFRVGTCDPHRVARNGAQAILRMTFLHGCFHADPHPGNILIQPGDVVCFMDFGTVGRLSQKMRDSISWLLIYLINRDYDAMARELVSIGDPLEEVNLDSLSSSLMDTLDIYHGATLRQIDLRVLIRSVFRLLVRYHLRLPSSYTLMLKSLVSVEGLGKSLHPEFDMTELARPFVEQLVMERWTPRRVAHDLEILALDGTAFLRRTPTLVARILSKLNRGALSFELQHRGLADVRSTVDRASNRLTFGLIISALLVSASMIMVQAPVPPGGGPPGIPISSLIGYGIALLLGAWLALGIVRSGGP